MVYFNKFVLFQAQNFVFKVQLQDMLPLNAKNKDAVNNYLQKKIFHKTSLIIVSKYKY